MTSNRQPETERIRTRDRQIVDHVARHRITTNEVLHKLFFKHRQQNAVTKVTARLCRAEWLSKFPLYHPRLCFTLGPLAAKRLGVPVQRTLPLGPQALPTEYATLTYVIGKLRHRRLTANELEQLCPWLIGPLADFPYCLDGSSEPAVLELIRVDLGGKPDYIARKCDADFQARRSLCGFDKWVREQRFRLVVITGTSEKAALIQSALEQHVWPAGLSIHLAVVPQLLQLTARIFNGT
jgi:hypothetical protein